MSYTVTVAPTKSAVISGGIRIPQVKVTCTCKKCDGQSVTVYRADVENIRSKNALHLVVSTGI